MAATITLLALVLLAAATCMHSPGSTGPEIERSLVLRLLPDISPALMDPQEPLNITRAHWDIRTGVDRQVLSIDSAGLDPDLPDDLVVTIKMTVDEDELEPEGHLVLFGDGPRPEWAGTFGPIAIRTNQEVWTIPVTMGRGDLVNLTVKSLAITGLENGLEEGASGTLAALTDGAQGTVVFWGSRDPEIATIDAQGRVLGVSPGDAKIVAAAGLQADSVTVRVHPSGS